jgi:S-adenosylmethionine:tRNA ribosyltransferase-isomerase
VGAEAAAAIARARAERRRVIAVGTTVARALESAALAAEDGGEVAVRPLLRVGASDTTLFIHPGYRFRIIDGLITNFHLPQSTLLMLVCAFAGRELVLAAYAHAVAARYRFFSYGDAMLVWPLQPRGAFA